MINLKSRPLLAIFIIVFIDVLSFTLILPYLPLFAEKFGATPAQVGLLITVFAFCQFIAGPTLGRLSDVYGRKPILALSQMGTCLGFAVLACAHTLIWVFVARIIDGITAGNITVAQATISDVTAPKDRARAFGLIGISFGLGFFLGPAISGYLVRFGYEAPAWAAAGLSLASVFSTLMMLPAPKPETKPRWDWSHLLRVFDFKIILDYLRREECRSPLLQFFFFNFSFTCSVAGFALYAERRFTWNGHPMGATEIGYVYAYLGFLGILIQGYFLGKVVAKLGEKKTSILGMILQGCGYMLYSIVFSIRGLLGAATLGSAGSSFTRASIMARISHSAGAREQGTVLGVSQSLGSIAAIIAPLAAGFLIEHVSLESWALLSGISAFIGLIV